MPFSSSLACDLGTAASGRCAGPAVVVDASDLRAGRWGGGVGRWAARWSVGWRRWLMGCSLVGGVAALVDGLFVGHPAAVTTCAL